MTSINANKCNTIGALTCILNTIDKKNKFTSVYVSIGCAVNMSEKDKCKESLSIDPKLEQQFPPFLKSLKEELPFEPLHIFLIDPMLELPPFMVLNSKKTNIGLDWLETYAFKKFGIKSYYNELSNIYVYAINDSVNFSPVSPHELEHITNIDKFINELNILSIMHKWFVVVHNFTGKNMKNVAIHHDKLLDNHIDHIIYGIGTRKDCGCFLDVTKPECNFVYTISSTDGIKVYNPFKKSNTTDMELVRSLNTKVNLPNCSEKTKKQHEIIKAQLWQYIKFKRKFIMIDLMTLIRQIGMLAYNKVVDISTFKLDNLYIENNYRPGIAKLLKNKQYYEALDFLINILKTELKSHISVIYKENTSLIIDHTISEMMSCENPYKWYNFLKKVIDDFDERTGTQINLIESDD